jgi:hypothetical protein
MRWAWGALLALWLVGTIEVVVTVASHAWSGASGASLSGL